MRRLTRRSWPARLRALFIGMSVAVGAAAILAPASSRSEDEIRLEDLSPPEGELDGVVRRDEWPPKLTSDNSIGARFEYRLESSERGEIDVELDGVDREFVIGGEDVGVGNGDAELRITVVCDRSSNRDIGLRRLTYSLAELDEDGNWVRTLAVGVRGVEYVFRCPGGEPAAD